MHSALTPFLSCSFLHFYQFSVSPQAFGVDIQWASLPNTQAVYFVQYRLSALQSSLDATASFLQSTLYPLENWPDRYAQYEASQVVDFTQEWQTDSFPLSDFMTTKLVRVQGLMADTYYDFRVIAYASNSIITSPPVQSNTANASMRQVELDERLVNDCQR